MEFITTGNRIAVENFDIGKIYTITWQTGNCKSLACTGKGTDFVMFQDQEPELLFCLTMDSAITVSSIDEGGGGAGTMNYNELENKPSINGFVLVGNKTGAELGLASQSDLEDYATNASVVAGLATKQDALSSSQLAAVNSGITSSDVAQIITNKNNISTLQTSLAVGSSDNAKVLTAIYEGGEGSYAWVTPSGGGGTTDYTLLENKPQINSVTLTGNKSLSDLGIAAAADIPTVPITEIQRNSSTISPVSGVVNISVPTSAADVSALPASTKYAGASTAGGSATSAAKLDTTSAGSTTQPVYFANGVPTATTYSLAKSVPSDAVFTDTTYESKSAASGGTAVSLCTTGEKYTWNNKSTLQLTNSTTPIVDGTAAIGTSTYAAKADHVHPTDTSRQAAITAQSPLSADVVSDTNTTHKFATQTQLDQISTNANNILTIEKSQGQKNIVNVADSSGTTWIDITVSLSAGSYALYFGNITTNATGTTCQIAILDGGTIKQYFRIGRGDNVSIPFVLANSITTIRLYAGEDYAGSNGKNISYTDMMVCDKAYYDGGMMDYQPYSMSLSAITAWILAHS